MSPSKIKDLLYIVLLIPVICSIVNSTIDSLHKILILVHGILVLIRKIINL